MKMRWTLPAFLIAAFALATGPAQAEMKSQWVEYTHGDTKLKAYMVYDDQMAGRRPAVLMIHAREGMTPKTLGLAETWAKLGYVSFRGRYIWLWSRRAAERRRGNAGADHNLHQGPRADACADPGGVRCPRQEPDGRCVQSRAHRLLL